MAKYNHLPIFQLAYKLIIEIYKMTHYFPREHKYTLGQKLKETNIEFIDFIILANSQENKTSSLKEARTTLERLRIYIRMSFDLKIINFKKYEFLSRSFEDLSRQLSGWQEWALKEANKKIIRDFGEPEFLNPRIQRAS